jgi:ParB-like chromosome segregation protein Spo0J
MNVETNTAAPAKPAAKAKPAPAKAAPKAQATAPALPAPTLQSVALGVLRLAPENARFGTKPPVADLLTSIVGVGNLLDPLHVYFDGDKGMVWDGGRRLVALQTLAGAKPSKLPPALQAGVPVLVHASKEAARLYSLATFVREAMHPAEEFLAYKALLDTGMGPQEIAAACAVEAPRVRKLLRLAGIAPAVLEAFRTGQIGLDVAEAFTLTDDHATQETLLKGYGEKLSKITSWQVRSALRTNAVRGDSATAKFVGREAYAAAGGRFLLDLFEDEGEEDWLDADLANDLFQKKLDALIEEIRAEGWAKVEVAKDYTYDRGYTRRMQWSDAEMAEGTVFLRFDYHGDLDIRRGYFPEKRTASGAQGGVNKAKTQPERYGFGHGGHCTMTHVATEATRVAIAANPTAAYDALLSQLAWVTIQRPDYSIASTTASTLIPERPNRHLSVNGSENIDAARTKWRARLPKDRVAFCEYVAGLAADEKAELLALSFAETISGSEGRFDLNNDDRWAHLGWMARHSGVDIVKAWTPDADFLKGGSKDALLPAVRAMGAEGNWNEAKKKELVNYAVQNAARVGWVPELLATFTEVKPGAEPAPGDLDDSDDDSED